MSFVWMDGFDNQDFAAGANKYRAAGTSYLTSTTGRTPYGSCISTTGAVSHNRVAYFGRDELSGADGTLILGFGFKYYGRYDSGSGVDILHIRSDRINRVTVQLDGDQIITVKVQGSAPVSYVLPADALFLSKWNHIEFKLVKNPTNGSLTMRINGVEVLNETNIPTTDPADTNPNWDGFQFYSHERGYYVDDLYVLNSLGTASNDFLGDLVISGSVPTAPGASTDLTPSTGTDNFALVDDVPPDTSTHVSSLTPGDRDTYTLTPVLGPGPGGSLVHAVQVNSIIGKDDAGVISGHEVLVDGANTLLAPDRVLPIDFYHTHYILEERPSAGGAWDIDAVNALETGWEVA